MKNTKKAQEVIRSIQQYIEAYERNKRGLTPDSITLYPQQIETLGISPEERICGIPWRSVNDLPQQAKMAG